MAQLKGPGSMKAVDLVVVTYPNNVTRDGKTQYLDVQINAKDPRGPGQSNLHLVTTRVKDPKTGETRFGNGAPYSMSQFEAIKAAAGDNSVTMDKGAQVYAVKADLMVSGRNSGLVLNTKTLAASDLKIDATVLETQIASAKAASKAAKEAAAEAQAEAPQTGADVQADAPEADAGVDLAKADEPAMA